MSETTEQIKRDPYTRRTVYTRPVKQSGEWVCQKETYESTYPRMQVPNPKWSVPKKIKTEYLPVECLIPPAYKKLQSLIIIKRSGVDDLLRPRSIFTRVKIECEVPPHAMFKDMFLSKVPSCFGRKNQFMNNGRIILNDLAQGSAQPLDWSDDLIKVVSKEEKIENTEINRLLKSGEALAICGIDPKGKLHTVPFWQINE